LRKPDPQSGFMERAIAAMRSWLWENIPCFEDKAPRWLDHQQLRDPRRAARRKTACRGVQQRADIHTTISRRTCSIR